MSSETVKMIVEHLNSSPFNLGTSLIAFDAFPASKLLQILSDVICWIMQTDHVDIQRESAEETAMRVLHNLRILKFRPPSDIEELEEWRAGIVEGSKRSIYPVLEYIFDNLDMLKERAYLAKYLVKVEIPSEVHDMDTAQLQSELAVLMDRFKQVHHEVVEVRQDSMILDDIRSDLKSMESEKEALMRKIEKAEKRVKNLPQLDRHMAAAEELRVQKDRLAELTFQRLQQRDAVIHAEKRLARLRLQLQEVEAAGEHIDPSDLIAQLEDEIATNDYIVNTKLTNEIQQKRAAVQELSKVSDLPAIDQKDIKQLQDQINEVTDRIKAVEEKRDRTEEGLEDNFSIFRHQANAIERKKAGVAQRLQEARQELSKIEDKVESKRAEVKNSSGIDVVTDKQLRLLASQVRNRLGDYKRKKAELDEMVSEKITLLRTMEIVTAKFNSLKEKIEEMGGEVDEEVNIIVPERPKTAAPRSNDVEELRQMIKEMMQRLDQKKDQVEPKKKEKMKRQEKFNEVNEVANSRKAEYERRKAQLEDGIASLKMEVEDLEDRRREATDGIEDLERNLEEKEQIFNQLQEGGDGLRQQLEEQIRSAEMRAEEYTRRRGTAGDAENARQQVQMWRSLQIMFEMKLSAARK